MKFIPGTTFINKTKKNTRFFAYNKIYILQDIKPVPGEKIVTYIFNVDGGLKEVNFNSIKEAENWLATIVV